MHTIYHIPSFYAHMLNGLFLFLAFILLYNNYSKIIRLEPYKLIKLTLLLSIGVGIHSLSHIALEKGYGYNPLAFLDK